ncbi:hypothetical protein R3P38DRAFT_2765014 [Favolaschia claudopus]|uniref:Uncharacterized protein n=1 Tax=Favolaschia claudopus TaxID=2862362 RepID=A0AAW0DDV1_9AGAR
MITSPIDDKRDSPEPVDDKRDSLEPVPNDLALTAAQDRECKIETLRAKEEGEELPEELQEWLFSYIGRPPVGTRPPGFVAGAAVRERVAARAAAREEALALGMAPPLTTKPPGYVAGADVRKRVQEKQQAREASKAEVRKMVAHREAHVRSPGDIFFRGGPVLQVPQTAPEISTTPVAERVGLMTKAEGEAVVAHMVELRARGEDNRKKFTYV